MSGVVSSVVNPFYGFNNAAVTALNPWNYATQGVVNPNPSYNSGYIPSMDNTPIPVDANGNVTYRYGNGNSITIRPDGTNTSVPYRPITPLIIPKGVNPGFINPAPIQTTNPTQNQYDWSGRNYTTLPSNVSIGLPGGQQFNTRPAPTPAPKTNPFAAVTKPAVKTSTTLAPKTAVSNQYTRTRTK